MSHDVFISHSSLDKLAADAVCHGLEAKGIRCWIAPRDQVAGRPYGEQITAAIESAQVMVLVFSDNVNNSQAVLNEINIAAGSNVTIVPFRIAKVEFNSELHFYLGRMHWLDAFPQPVDAYIDALIETIQRNLKRPIDGAEAVPAGAATATQSPVAPPLPPPPAPPAPPPGLVATHPAPTPPKGGVSPAVIVGGALGGLLLILLIVLAWPRPPNPAMAQATNTAAQALANSIAHDDDTDTGAGNAAATTGTVPKADGSEIVPVRAANPVAVRYYETLSVPGGPPTELDGATVINTQQLTASMRDRDTGSTTFFLIDARGCSSEPTIPTAVCLTTNGIDQLEAKVPDKATQLVIFCHDGGCPLSYQLASAAVTAGYDNVFWYRGGINAWAAAGLPTVTHNGADQ